MNFWDYLNARAIRNANIDVLIARTQRSNTFVYAFIFTLSIALLIFLPNPSEVAKTILIGSSATLGTILIMQNQFWYGRPRGAGVPNPETTTTTTTTQQTTVPTPPAQPVIIPTPTIGQAEPAAPAQAATDAAHPPTARGDDAQETSTQATRT